MLNIKNNLIIFWAVFTLLNLTALTNKSFAGSNNLALLKCAKENNKVKRLSCFDTLVVQIKLKVNSQLADKTVLDSTDSIIANKNDIVTSVPSIKPQQSSEFGQEHKLKKQELITKQVEFTVKSAKLSLRKNWRLVFENGQVWHATESNSTVKFKVGNIVIIKRGLFNSFSMRKKDSKRSVHAKRIK